MTVKSRNLEAEQYRVITQLEGPSRTQQAFKKDCDINLIVRRHAQTGMWDHVSPIAPSYGDVTAAVSLQDAIAASDLAWEMFMQQPARVREAVENNPVRFLEAIADEDQYEHLAELGMPVPDGWKPRPTRGEATPAPAAGPQGAPAPAPHETAGPPAG